MKREPLTYRIPRFSVSRPVSVVMILLSMLVVGFIAYLRIPIALFPEGLEGNMLYIQASYPNASPRDVEEKVTRKIEDIVGTVANVKKINSYSRNGGCSLRIEFQTGTNLRAAYAMLSDRIDRVKPLLPDDVDRINVYRFDSNDNPMMNLVAAVPPDMDDAAYRLDNFVKPALQRIEGVGNVGIWGIQSREIQVELADDRLRSHRIDPSQMLGVLRAQNFTQSGGYVYEAGKKIYVRSLGRFESAEQIGELIIDPERRLRLRDVANVSFRLPKRDWAYRVDGQTAIGVQITRESTGNIERISREVRATMAELQDLPQLAGMKFEVFFDQGKEVRDSIGNTVIAAAMEDIRIAVSEGEGLNKPLDKAKVFPPMVTQMVAIGEETGAIDAMLEKIADFYDEEVETAVHALTSMLEPLMMVLIGGIVGSIIIGMYLPIFDIVNKIK